MTKERKFYASQRKLSALKKFFLDFSELDVFKCMFPGIFYYLS